MVTKPLHIRESVYTALKAQKRAGESFSDVFLRVTVGDEKSVCNLLQTIDPAIRREIAASVEMVKTELDCLQALRGTLTITGAFH